MPPPPYTDEKLNTVIAIGLLIALAGCICIYGFRPQTDGQIMQLASMIAGGLTGFIARGVRQTGSQGNSTDVDASKADSVTVNTAPPAAPVETAGSGGGGV